MIGRSKLSRPVGFRRFVKGIARKEKYLRFASIALIIVVFAGAACGREILPLGPQGIAANAFPKPDRPVAAIISPIWATEDERRSVDETRQVFEAMAIRPGMVVADIGAGSGFYTVQLSARLGPGGLVFAQDVMPDYLRALDQRIATLGLTNVRIGLGDVHDPRLPQKSLDAALLIHMYHEIEQPYGLLYNLASALKAGGKVGIVDLNRPTLQHGTPPELLRCEVERLGYRQTAFKALEGQVGYLAVFDAPASLPPLDSIRPCSASR